ncbi:serine protease inhibitor ecotin [Chryseobacterium sediminis]|uniref:Serine protease inhibitor ecotin n=1 Tax=Chryseobacterium sediminis TaxID=1679494 RepID=A0ABR6Q1H7_9FLAO|nr:ecotin family protein [Chryseobacterium sediminis]MBB6331825.1 serine protease inhibitor ecotin [Chryseobacterium sediminis]
MKNLILFFSILYSLNMYSQEKPNYPEPEKGMKRVDLKLPKIENNKEYKVEIRFGIEMDVSECSDINNFSFNRKNLEERYGISPSRFPYYVLPKEIPVEVLTFNKPNCDETKKVKKKVLSSQNIFREYNGYYAIPFYIPEKWTVEYRLWKVDSEFKNVEK